MNAAANGKNAPSVPPMATVEAVNAAASVQTKARPTLAPANSRDSKAVFPLLAFVTLRAVFRRDSRVTRR
jgi:hypothetical protein